MKLIKPIAMGLSVLLFLAWGVACAAAPAALVFWTCGEWKGDALFLGPEHKGAFITAVVFGNVTGIAGGYLFVAAAVKVEEWLT